MPKKWVVKASPVIVLARINHLFLLQRLAKEIVVPAGVAKEIAQGPGDDPTKEWLRGDGQALVWEVEVVPPVIIGWNLGLGESEVLGWAYQNPGYEALLDDRAARNCALSLNIPVRGTIGVLLLAKRFGHLKENPCFAAIGEGRISYRPHRSLSSEEVGRRRVIFHLASGQGR